MMVFTDHIMYEIKMLRMAYWLLGVPWHSEWVGNSLIEAFCIHARALLEFFEGETSESDEKVCAFHFTNNTYRAFSGGKVNDRLRGKLHAQIAHLSYQRSKDDSDKIGSADRKALLELLNKEIDNFAAHLKSQYKEKWPADLGINVQGPTLPTQNMTGMVTGPMRTVTMTPQSVVSRHDVTSGE